MATGLEHSSTGADRHIIHIGVIHECVSDVEGRGISARNAGQLVHLPLTNRSSDRTLCVLQHFPCPFSTVHATWTTASERFSSSPPPQPMPPPPPPPPSPAYSPSQPKPSPLSFYEPSVPPSESDWNSRPGAFTAQLASPGDFMALYVASASSTTGRRHIVYHTRPYSLTDSSWCLPASRVSATDIELPVRSTTSVPVSNVSPSPHLRYPPVSK